MALFGGKSHQKQSKNTYFLLILLDFFSCQKGHFDVGCAIKGSLEGGYKHRVGAVGGVRQGATQGAMGYTPGGGEGGGGG